MKQISIGEWSSFLVTLKALLSSLHKVKSVLKPYRRVSVGFEVGTQYFRHFPDRVTVREMGNECCSADDGR